MTRKNMIHKDMKNKKMCKDVYKLRRRVMDFIYEAKKVADIPRILVRITDNNRENKLIRGSAGLKDNIIWIPEDTFDYNDTNLRWVVYHELIHAITGFRHNNLCILMCPHVQKDIPKVMVQNTFVNYIRKWKK